MKQSEFHVPKGERFAAERLAQLNDLEGVVVLEDWRGIVFER